MRIEELKPASGAYRKKKRRGRGSGSGHGKTSCRGSKGALARSGARKRPGFEGGQMPLIRRLPKRGFTSRFARDYQIVNLGRLNVFSAGAVVEPKDLYNAGLIKKRRVAVKILGEGNLQQPLTVRADAFSRRAVEKIKHVQGKAEIIEKT